LTDEADASSRLSAILPGMNAARLALVLATVTGLSGTVSAAPPARPVRSAARSRSVLPFIADDYTRAIAEARARKVPIFIEAWAPW
jgi:hypothetical protein